MTQPPFRLVSDALSDDTVECLTALLRDSKSGACIGIAFAAVYSKPKRSYIVNTAGECTRSPTFTLGMVSMLEDHLRDKERSA